MQHDEHVTAWHMYNLCLKLDAMNVIWTLNYER